MPKGKKKSGSVKKEPDLDLVLSELSADESPRVYDNNNDATNCSMKRSYTSDPEMGEDCENVNTNSDFGGDMSKFVENLGVDMNKALQAKRKRMEQYTAGAIKANQAKIKEMWQYQAENRKTFNEELYKNVTVVINQWEADLAHFREQEDKMLKIIHQQVKLTKEMRTSQLEKIETLRKLHDSFYKGWQEQETQHSEQCNNMQAELKKELISLQKKIMMKSQQEEMANMQKSLKSMFFM
ncbi:synaptonemal complex protein 3-like [Anabrus simplex]|uniref:synaptonemal complex protein 3-like n=1 Tax=Anabrus simplex TaxID=316456 RepID=UPI0034DD7313